MAEMSISSLRGKWAQGIKPREFMWVLKDQLAVSERIGGKGENHRPIRRQEEIVWILNNSIDLTISLIPAPHNLEAYKKLGLPHRHWPVPSGEDPTIRLPQIYEQMGIAIENNKTMLMHRITLDDTVMGFMGGFLIWGGYLESATDTTVMIERLFGKQVGPKGRVIINTLAADPTMRKGITPPPRTEEDELDEAAADAQIGADVEASTDDDLADEAP